MSQKKTIILYYLISIALVFFFYGGILLSPNSFLFSLDGDGITHFYSYAYYILNNIGGLEFEGMNYPYGEHINYAVGHPLLASIIKGVPFLNLAKYSIGILNFILIIQLVFSGRLILSILKKLQVNSIFAIGGAIAISFLSTQILRLSGHPSLAYSLCIPLTWVLLMMADDKKSSSFVYLIGGINLMWFFVHPYLAILNGGFVVLHSLSTYLLYNKNVKHLVIKILSSVIIPIACYSLFNLATDNHVGRTTTPSGFFLYNAEPDDVFVPNHPPLSPVINSFVKVDLEWEAWSYVGLSTVLLLATIILMTIVQVLVKRKKKTFSFVIKNKLLTPALMASMVMLLFAFGVPFKQLPALLDVIPGVSLLRTTGRFTWPFFFVITISGIYIINHIFINGSFVGYKKYIIPVLFVVITFIEAVPYHSSMSRKITSNSNPFISNLSEDYIPNINYDKFQAIIPLPYYFYGSENYSRPVNKESLASSLILSFHSKLPLLASNLARISIQESKNMVQVVSPSYYPKQIERDIVSRKDFLILVGSKKLTDYEKLLLGKAHFITDFNSNSYYSISHEALFSCNTETAVKRFDEKKLNLFREGDFYTSKKSGVILSSGFDKLLSDKVLIGKGAYQGVKRGKNIFLEVPAQTLSNRVAYRASVWMYNAQENSLNQWLRLIVDEYDEASNTHIETVVFPEQSEVIFDEWSLVEIDFRVQNPKNRIKLYSIGKESSKAKLYVDNLLIRERKVDVYALDVFNGQETLMYNNHILDNCK